MHIMNIAFVLFIVIVAVVGNAPLAIFLGIIFSLYFKPDINFISRKVSTTPLQIGIVILGSTINLSFILDINPIYIVLISLFVFFSFIGGLIIGRVLKLNSNMTILLSSGAAICGGTAMVAVAPIIKAKPSELIVSLTIVFMLNAIAIVFFPMIATYLQMGNEEFGAFAALAIHDTSSVVGAAIQYSPESVEMASVLKLGRTLWLIPLLFVLNYKFNKDIGSSSYPKFIIFFVMAIILNTIFNFSYETQLMLGVISKAFLMAGLFCIGTQTSLIDLKSIELSLLHYLYPYGFLPYQRLILLLIALVYKI